MNAAVTSYILHYTRGSDTGSVSASSSNTFVVISDLIADGNDYEIIVEAESIHISGFSDPVRYQPCKLLPQTVEYPGIQNTICTCMEKWCQNHITPICTINSGNEYLPIQTHVVTV